MKKILAITIFAAVAGLAAACSTAPDATTYKTATMTNAPTANTAAPKTEEVAPAAVKEAFPDAQSFTKQHKDIPQNAVADIEKDAGAKVPDTDHLSYLAFSNAGGTRKQIGAATVVKADGKEFVIIYDNKDGSPVIKEVRGEGVSNDFLKQFGGKGHDNDLTLGKDIKAEGVDEAMAKAVTQAVKIDVMTMQTLYGSAHSH